MSIKDLTFDGFPTGNGLWWLRWIDYGAATIVSRSAYLNLLFSRLPDTTQLNDLPILNADVAANRSLSHLSKVHVGWLPVLRIGLVVQNGTVVGALGAELRCFYFERPMHEERLESLLHAEPAVINRRRQSCLMAFNGSKAFEVGNRPGLLNPLSYPLPGVSDGRLLTFGAASQNIESSVLMLPCAEVLRVSYAPHASLARAIIDSGWSRGISRILDLGLTGPLEDGSGWQVVALSRLREEHLAIAANLAINPVARCRANLVSSEIAIASHPVLTALLPFEWKSLNITVACIKINTNTGGERWFGYTIESLEWPPPPHGPAEKIIWTMGDNPQRGKKRKPSNKDAPLRTYKSNGAFGRLGRVDQHHAPSRNKTFDVIDEGVNWINAPTLLKIKKAVKLVHSKHRVTVLVRRDDSAQLFSAEPGTSRNGLTPVDPQSVIPRNYASLPSAHFQEVNEMLEELMCMKYIESNELEIPEGEDLEVRGDIAAWAFPKLKALKKSPNDSERHWYLRDFARKQASGNYTELVRRSAMVRRLVVNSCVVWWFEIEPRSYRQDRNRALIFTLTGMMTIVTVIRFLLGVGAERAGVWPPSAYLKQMVETEGKFGIATCTSWEHTRLEPTYAARNQICSLSKEKAYSKILMVIPK